MQFTELNLPGVLLIEPKIFGDSRGYFFESFNEQKFCDGIGKNIKFVQDNHSKSSKGVLRGLHYQLYPKAQGKLVRVVEGEVFDVAVDMRTGSPTFGKWASAILSAENKKQLWIPEGFIHGFLTLSNTAEVLYKATNYYAPELERCIRWDDPTVDVKWPVEEYGLSKNQLIISEKDMAGVSLKYAETF